MSVFAGRRSSRQKFRGKCAGIQAGRFEAASGRGREDEQAIRLMQFCSHRPDSPAFFFGSRRMLEPQQIIQRTVQVKLYRSAIHCDLQDSLSMNMRARRLGRSGSYKSDCHACGKYGFFRKSRKT
jgi:hypothetical protein